MSKSEKAIKFNEKNRNKTKVAY